MAKLLVSALLVALYLGAAKGTPQLALNATAVEDGDYVKVTISGVTSPTIQDAVGLYLGSAPSPNLTAPVKYQWAANSPAYLTSGSGSLTFQVLNMRDNVTFLLFSNVSNKNPFSNVSEVAASPVLAMSNPNEPLHGHLAVTKIPGEMIVQWQTRDAGTPTVKLGTSSGQYTSTATGSNITFTAAQMCGAPANSTGFVNPGAINRVLLTNLTANTRYYYVYGDPSFGFSKESSFLTSPPVGPQSTLQFLVVADLGHAQLDGSFEYDYDESADILNYQATGHNVDAMDATTIADYYVDLIIDNVIQQGASRHTVAGLTSALANKTLLFLNGDISYARGEIAQWDTFWSQMTNLTQQIPIMVQLGNHERDFPGSGDRFNDVAIDSGGECGVVTNSFFDMPYGNTTYVDPVGKIRVVEWYSFDQGPVHFLELSSEVDFSPGSPQHNYIVKDLAAVNRTATPWIVVNFHRPNYAAQFGSTGSITSGLGVAADWRAATEELFFLNNVDITFSGHVHGYQRTCPVYQLECLGYNSTDQTANAPVNVMLGNAGYALTFQAITSYPPYWDIMALEHGYASCSANATTFTCTEYSSMNGKVLDQFTLHKPANWNATAANAARATVNSLFASNFSDSNVLDADGLPGAAYTSLLGATSAAFKSNTTILAALASMNNSTRSLENAVNGADTVVDIWDSIEPTIEVVQGLASSSDLLTRTYGSWFLELFESLRVAADAYPTMSGVMYRSSRIGQPMNALATAQTALAQSA